MSYDTHCSSCGMPYSDFAREGAKSCECHKMAAQAVRDFVFDKPALSAAPVAQEPVAWQWRYKGPSLAVDDDGWSVWLPIEYSIESFRETFADKIERGTVEYRPLYAGTPPATPAGVGADEIARALKEALVASLDAQGTPIISGFNSATTAILALLSRAVDQSNSTHEEQSTQNISRTATKLDQNMMWYWRVRIYNTDGDYWHAQVATGRDLKEIDGMQEFYHQLTGCKMLIEGMSERSFDDLSVLQESFAGLWLKRANSHPDPRGRTNDRSATKLEIEI